MVRLVDGAYCLEKSKISDFNGMSSGPYSFHIHLRGRVQGVGFRPFVYRLAQAWGLNGMVCNAPDGVHIELDAPEETAQKFYQALLEQAPRLSLITAATFSKTTARLFKNFSIAESDEQAAPEVLLTPDFALCPDCRAELQSPENRRQGYAFITCTNCGPRYSIVNGLPYDRPLTTMQPFEMCPACQVEYNDPLDRRYYSQTNSCPDCGIQLSVFPDADLGKETAIDFAIRQLSAGKVLAVKGIGGYLLMCDATNASSVRTLRARKHRPSKPFAVLYANLEMLAADVELQSDEIQALTGAVAPIVL
ncbi:MAG: acylphosphatase, partial [Bacteroidota bacterium]